MEEERPVSSESPESVDEPESSTAERSNFSIDSLLERKIEQITRHQQQFLSRPLGVLIPPLVNFNPLALGMPLFPRWPNPAALFAARMPLVGIPPGPLSAERRAPPNVNKPPPVKKYKCDVCNKAFSRSNTLITHKRIHTGEKPFKCDHCGRAFRQPGNLTRHRLTHTTVKPYVCSQCGKAFNRASNLHTHMRTHNNYRPFICPYCGKGFHQKIDMKIHIYTHTGERPFHTAAMQQST